jgi:hypothetical protein
VDGCHAGCAAGPERRGAAQIQNKNSFSYSFPKTTHKKANLEHFQIFFRKVPKIKVAPFFMLSNFA